ncbi:MAG: type III pantothenate kinase, partial [Gammaproteobacteria bacterium]|nr:type III pantothenate kinase [Gammaproteobacteria bacterium]
RGLSVLTSRLSHDVDTVWASNVAGSSFGARLAAVLGIHCQCETHFVRVRKQAYGVTVSYARPRSMGVDRWVAMIGAWAELKSACVIVDAGTAVTIDALDDSGMHLGGQILAGVGLMIGALANATSDIPAVSNRRRAAAKGMAMFASTTASSVQLGALNAVIGAIERACRTLREHGHSPALILTGGDASRILQSFDEPAMHRPQLVLSGLAHMLENH